MYCPASHTPHVLLWVLVLLSLNLPPGGATSPLQSKAISACREGALKDPPRRRVNWSTPSISSLNHGAVNNVMVLLLLMDFMVVPVHMLVTISICMVALMGHVVRTPSTSWPWTQGPGLGVICPVLVLCVRLGVECKPVAKGCRVVRWTHEICGPLLQE